MTNTPGETTVLRPVYGSPGQPCDDYCEPACVHHAPSVGWDLSVGSRIDVGPVDTADNRLVMSLHLGPDYDGSGVVRREVTPEQVAAYARQLLALVGRARPERRAAQVVPDPAQLIRFMNWARPGTARDRWNGRAIVRTQDGGKVVDVTLLSLPDQQEFRTNVAWTPDKPQPGHTIRRTWRHVDPDGGRWTIERGYDGCVWMLFGPNGDPWGYRLLTTIDHSLGEASVWVATEMRPRENDPVHQTDGNES